VIDLDPAAIGAHERHAPAGVAATEEVLPAAGEAAAPLLGGQVVDQHAHELSAGVLQHPRGGAVGGDIAARVVDDEHRVDRAVEQRPERPISHRGPLRFRHRLVSRSLKSVPGAMAQTG
jgi:hypothetical protein